MTDADKKLYDKAVEALDQMGAGLPSEIEKYVPAWIDGYKEGLKAKINATTISDCPIKAEWHKVADGDLPKGGENSIHRDIYLKDRYGNLYTGNYYPKDETHTEDCFAVEFLEWGFQGSQFCKKAQIAEWCEIPKFEV